MAAGWIELFCVQSVKLARSITTNDTTMLNKKIVSDLFIAAGIVAIAVGAVAADKVDASKLPPVAAKKDVTFDKDIKPMFEASCTKCHGAEKQKGKLRVDTYDGTMKGGEGGPMIEKGNSAKSTVVHVTARLNEDDAMPPTDKGKPLTKDQVGLIRAWIDQGAKK
jgi:uncharacterized membrane protein